MWLHCDKTTRPMINGSAVRRLFMADPSVFHVNMQNNSNP